MGVDIDKMPNVESTDNRNATLNIAKGEKTKMKVTVAPSTFSLQMRLFRIIPRATIKYIIPALKIDIVNPQSKHKRKTEFIKM